MTNKQVIFVQGGKKDEVAFPWMFFHFDPVKDVDPSPVRLVYFDYPGGKIKTWDKWTMKRDKAPPPSPDKEEEITPKTQMRLKAGTLDEEKPSILGLYDFVKKQDKESIISLQIFSHGWMGGPIIWNSSEYGPAGEKIDTDWTLPRDPHDTDPRMRDFFGSNPLAGTEGQKFVQALAPDAFVKLWGCVAPDGIRPSVQRFIFSPKNDQQKAANQARLSTYLDAIKRCFAFVMARELKIPVWAAPLGWGSEANTNVPIAYKGEEAVNMKVTYQKKFPPDLKKDQWWRVSFFFRNGDRGAKFYTDVLKARIDATDYVEFKQSWFDDAQREATASLEPGIITSPRDLQERLLDRVRGLA